VRTTASNHSFRVYPNLAGEMKLTGVDQLWIADIIHVLLLPKVSPSRLPQSLKGAMARQANLLLGRTGETFWQAASYDRWVRDESEWDRIAAYIEDNPVKAGLVRCAEDYRWSSAGKWDKSAETRLGAVATSGCATTGSPRLTP
jgi:hypothetical protein